MSIWLTRHRCRRTERYCGFILNNHSQRIRTSAIVLLTLVILLLPDPVRAIDRAVTPNHGGQRIQNHLFGYSPFTNPHIRRIDKPIPNSQAQRRLRDLKITWLDNGHCLLTWNDTTPLDQGVVSYALKIDSNTGSYQTTYINSTLIEPDPEPPLPDTSGSSGLNYAYACSTAYFDKNQNGQLDTGEKLGWAYNEFYWNWQSDRFPRTYIRNPRQNYWKRADWNRLGWIGYAEVNDTDDGVYSTGRLKITELNWHDHDKSSLVRVGSEIIWKASDLINHFPPTVTFIYDLASGTDSAVPLIRFYNQSTYK